jgi:hypothetical protein
MRILEDCMRLWPTPEIQAQVNNLRKALSADITKPFKLKPGFPLETPAQQSNVSSLPDIQFSSVANQDNILVPSGQVNFAIAHHPITPPISTTEDETAANSPCGQSMGLMANQNQSAQTTLQPQATSPHVWNPTRLFE